jgi:hypothetical protein
MAISFDQFMEATGAELVAGNIIVGIMGDRKKVGSLDDDGVFNLNDEGKALAEEAEASGGKKTTRAKKADAPVEAAPEA